MVDDPRRRRDEAEPAATEPEVLSAGQAQAAADALPVRTVGQALAADEDLPVVARLVVEIRSDGTRTVARGALEDASSGVKTAVVARGSTPLRLALDLARAVGQLPGLVGVRGAVRGLLGRRSGR